MEPDLALARADPVDGHNKRHGVRKVLLGSAIALSTLGLAVPAWGAGGAPTKTVEYFPDVTFEIPINNPCTGDPGITTTNDFVTITTWTYPDGSKNINIQDKGTFVFVPTDPTKPTYYATAPTVNTQVRLDPGGVGTYKTVGSYPGDWHRRFTGDGTFDHGGPRSTASPSRTTRSPNSWIG